MTPKQHIKSAKSEAEGAMSRAGRTHISTYLYYGVFGYRVVEYGIL